MPTLIRLLVILLVLVGIGFGAMFALVATVQPREKDVTIRIPSRELVASPERAPLVRREIDTTRDGTTDNPAAAPADAPAADAPAATADAPPANASKPDANGVVTVEQGEE